VSKHYKDLTYSQLSLLETTRQWNPEVWWIFTLVDIISLFNSITQNNTGLCHELIRDIGSKFCIFHDINYLKGVMKNTRKKFLSDLKRRYQNILLTSCSWRKGLTVRAL